MTFKSLTRLSALIHVKQFYFIPICLLFLIGSANAETKLRINTSIKPPFSTESHTGFFDILIKDLFSHLDISVEIVRLPAERAMANVNNGLSDGELPRISGLSKKYKNIIQVPEKIMDYSFVAFSQPEKISKISFESIKSKKVGIIIGWKIYENETLDFPHLSKVAKPQLLFSMMTFKRIDVALYERYAGQFILKTQGIKNIYECTPPLATKAMFLYVNKKHKEKVPILADGLREMKKNGIYWDIYNQTLGAYKPN
tara:strand:+ start:2803 stop:3570 length:768 start_codon:yes stop_codon:yes gene_type:complete